MFQQNLKNDHAPKNLRSNNSPSKNKYDRAPQKIWQMEHGHFYFSLEHGHFSNKLGSVAGPIIQANGRLTFEDDLRSGGLLYFTTQ